ncbi:16S rRNA (guanine(527)-N(7))-methyltransferase RsmG [Pelolinea submarina]|uniref:Ribosomal RNA small subunit methyltransferase G n=1 Tax=Pelolinea submarina TaxID=913107 RepID=A0A347ZSK6_9CHLR|nr:16S rRNA (guanine(527)-N(7))-methyltransferase RsmG [Pelolinea submarina]REG11146.1 16S rRNA m(7)G-527 methyltransferase [Pelolinea submarina]BBB48287.1 16S rRNA (guanine527-N7)-methyltransferase [Pelolinea submarina]
MLNLKSLLAEHTKIDLTPVQSAAFEHYQALLLEWNQKFNLTAITDPQEMQLKHFYDSLTCLRAIPPDAKSLIDIGCGAGLPGIPLKIMLPGLKLVLVDSVGKKVEFCKIAAQELGLTDVTALHARVEDLGQDKLHREQYDWAVARAVAPLPVLAEYLLPLVCVGGSMLAQKGASAASELELANKAIRILGGGQAKVDSFELPVTHDQRALIQVVKERNTPAQYPRKAGTPSKKPLG